MSERDVAEGALEQASGFSSAPPGATCPCKKPPRLRAGVFFDGTDNNKSRDKPLGKQTNVVRMHEVWREFTDAEALRRKCYLRGVGSMDHGERASQLGKDVSWNPLKTIAGAGGYVADVGYNLAGKIGGAGGKTRLNLAYFWLRDRCGEVTDAAERTVDIYGFSRGAAIARTFVNLVNQGLQREQPLLRVRFLGIFDTVGSFGLPGDDSDPGENIGIDTLDAQAIVHCTARHEYRQNFPLTRTPTSDTAYTGCHSDVGGGYRPVDEGRLNHLAFIPFVDMHKAGVDAKVDLDPAAGQIPGDVDVEKLREQALAEAPEDARLLDPKVKWTPEQQAFHAKYIHQSHTTPSDWWFINQAKRTFPHHIDNSGWRRVLDVRRQTLVALPPEFEWK
jgi:hypothetical protein